MTNGEAKDTQYQSLTFNIHLPHINYLKELAKRFIDKECVISSFDGNHQYEGIIKEVTDGAILVEKDGKIEALNLDFVIRIREYPRNKKGKKKSIVLD